jgi:hypothetical protein
MHADRALIRVSGTDITKKMKILIRNTVSNFLQCFLLKLRLTRKNKNKGHKKNSKDDFSFRIFLFEFENLDGYVENIENVNVMNFQSALGQVVTARTYASSACTSLIKRKNDPNSQNEHENEYERYNEKLRKEYYSNGNNSNNNNNSSNDNENDSNKIENTEDDKDFFSSLTTWDPLNFFGEKSFFTFPNLIPTSDVLTSARTAVQIEKDEKEQKIRDIEVMKRKLIEDKKLKNRIKKFFFYCLDILHNKLDLVYSFIMNMISIRILKLLRYKKEKNKEKGENRINEINNLNGNCSKTVENFQKHWGIRQLFLLDKIMVHDIKIEILNICDKTETIYLKNFLMLGSDFVKNDEIENLNNNNNMFDNERDANDYAKHIEIELGKEAELTSSFTAYCNSLKRTAVGTTVKNVHDETEIASNSLQFAADEKSGYSSDLTYNSSGLNKKKDMYANRNENNNKMKNTSINPIINHDNELIPKSNNNSIYETNYGEIGHHLDTIIFRIWALIKTNLITQNRSKIMKIGAAVAFTRTKSAFLSPFTTGFSPSSKGKIAWNKRSAKAASPGRPIIIDRTDTDYSYLNRNVGRDNSTVIIDDISTTNSTDTGTNASTNSSNTANSTYNIGGVYGISGSSSKMNVLYEATMGFLSSSRSVTPTIFSGPGNDPGNSPGTGVGVGTDPKVDPIIGPFLDRVLHPIHPVLDPNLNTDPQTQRLSSHPNSGPESDPVPGVNGCTTREMRGQSSISICTSSTEESYALCGVSAGQSIGTKKEVEKKKEREEKKEKELERCKSADYAPVTVSPNLPTTATDSTIYGSRSYDPQSSQSPRYYPRAPSMEMPQKLRPPSIRISAIRSSFSSERTTPVSARTPPAVHSTSTFLGPLPFIPNPSGVSPKNSFPASPKNTFSLSPRRSGSPRSNGKSGTPNGFSPKSPASGIFNATFKSSTVTLTAAVNTAAGGISGKR